MNPSLNNIRHTHPERTSMVVVMVGLPGRGKSYVARRICRWLNWNGIPCRIFNCGDYRREIAGQGQDAEYFKNSGEDRDNFCKLACTDLLGWITQRNDRVGILDATNHSRARRDWLFRDLGGQLGAENVIWVEVICNNTQMIAQNIQKAKLPNKDYRGKDPTKAKRDFLSRIEAYQEDYAPLCTKFDAEKSFVQWEDDSVECHKITTSLSKRIAYFIMNLSTKASVIYLTTPGESTHDVDNLQGTKGAGLTTRGSLYTDAVAEFVASDVVADQLAPLEEESVEMATQAACGPRNRGLSNQSVQSEPEAFAPPEGPKLLVWTAEFGPSLAMGEQLGGLPRGSGSWGRLEVKFQEWQALNELDHGVLEGRSLEHQEARYPGLGEALAKNRFLQSYPGGESYQTMNLRLEPVLLAIENSSHPVLIVADRCVQQALIAYFYSATPEVVPDIEAPAQHVLKCTFLSNSVNVSSYPSQFTPTGDGCSISQTPNEKVSV